MENTLKSSDRGDDVAKNSLESASSTDLEPPALPSVADPQAEVEWSFLSPHHPTNGSDEQTILPNSVENADIIALESSEALSEDSRPTDPMAESMLPPSIPLQPNTDVHQWEMGENATAVQAVNDQDSVIMPPPAMTRGSLSKRGGRGSRGGPGSRGGRGGRPKIKIEPPPEDVDPAAPPRKINRGGRPRGSRAGGATSTRGVNKGGRPRGSRAALSASTGRGTGKLKRKRSKGGDNDHSDDDEINGNSDSSEEITALPTQSRSGRRITQVVSPSAAIVDLDAALKPIASPTTAATTTTAARPLHLFSLPSTTSPLTKKPLKRKRIALSAVCHNCGRGHSPQTNQIVFCDGCNTPWHQYCHDRPITPSVILEEEKEWHCADCAAQVEEAAVLAGRVPLMGGEGMGWAERRRVVEGMERAELVALLLRAWEALPDLPVLKARVGGAGADGTVGATAAAAATMTMTPQGAVAKGEAEFEFYEPQPLPYPKAGNGVFVPPEGDDVEMGIMVDEDVVTYSHSWVDGGGGWVGPMGTGIVVGA